VSHAVSDGGSSSSRAGLSTESGSTRASRIETAACRCLTVENETSFHELAKLRSSELLICMPGAKLNSRKTGGLKVDLVRRRFLHPIH